VSFFDSVILASISFSGVIEERFDTVLVIFYPGVEFSSCFVEVNSSQIDS